MGLHPLGIRSGIDAFQASFRLLRVIHHGGRPGARRLVIGFSGSDKRKCAKLPHADWQSQLFSFRAVHFRVLMIVSALNCNQRHRDQPADEFDTEVDQQAFPAS